MGMGVRWMRSQMPQEVMKRSSTDMMSWYMGPLSFKAQRA